MQIIFNRYTIQLMAFSLLLLSVLSMQPSASAAGFNEGGGGATGTVKLEPFVVNLASFDHFLQATITLKLGAPELSEKIKQMMPKVRHTVIVVLSSKDTETMKSSEGKKSLIKELKTKLNKILEAKEHEGIDDIFLENFIIQ